MSATAVRSTPAVVTRPWLTQRQHVRGWPFGTLTEQQLTERARFEAAMRADRLRGLPSAFGRLA